MPKYLVNITFTAYGEDELTVEADNREEAEAKALQEACFDLVDLEEERRFVNVCEEIDPEPACPEERRLRSLGYAELPGIAV